MPLSHINREGLRNSAAFFLRVFFAEKVALNIAQIQHHKCSTQLKYTPVNVKLMNAFVSIFKADHDEVIKICIF